MKKWPKTLYCRRNLIPLVNQFSYVVCDEVVQSKDVEMYIHFREVMNRVREQEVADKKREIKLIKAAYLDGANQYWDKQVTEDDFNRRCIIDNIYKKALNE